METHFTNIIGNMILLCQQTDPILKPYFSTLVLRSAIYGFTGADDIAAQQQALWNVC